MLDARRLPRPGLIDSISGTMATGTRRLVAIAALTAVLWFLWAQLYPVDNAGITTIDEPADAAFPRKIWQTWSIPAQELGGTFQSWSVSWIDVNPNYRYELLTSNSASTYVREKYERQRPDIVEVFEALHNDAILRADLLRYLALFADGGVYADMDTDCTRPIDDWIPGEYLPSANLVVGLEYDAQGGEIRGDFTIAASLGQWTFMARPGSPALALVIDKVIEAVLRLYEVNQTMPTFTGEQVIDVTGPHMFTNSILEYLSIKTGTQVSYSDISNLTEPKLIADVLVLPINAFGTGQDHSGSKEDGNSEQLMRHHWYGWKGWRVSHPG